MCVYMCVLNACMYVCIIKMIREINNQTKNITSMPVESTAELLAILTQCVKYLYIF